MTQVVFEEIYKGRKIKVVHNSGFGKLGMFQDWYCGYVEVKKGKKLYKNEDIYSMGFDVHGGITFAGTRNDIFEENGKPDESWYVGFDTMHFYSGSCNNIEFCKKEVKRLADMLEEVEE